MLKHWCNPRAKARSSHMVLTVAVIAALAALGTAAPALANFAQFAQCPTGSPGVEYCSFAQTTSGEFSIGKTKVPINKTITLQGGPIPTGTGAYFLFPAKNGESLSKTELNVPGGLLNIINCEEITGEGFFEQGARALCKATFENKTTGVTATTELVATATNPAILNTTNILIESGTALTLPVRVHLKNPFLGNNCYVGSESSPIQLHLTTGTTSPPAPNKPISGKAGTLAEEEEEILVINENSLVDNSFSTPTSEGCGEFLFIKGYLDSIVNKKLGLPSAAGNNTAILNGTLKIASANAVVKHGF